MKVMTVQPLKRSSQGRNSRIQTLPIMYYLQ